MMGHFWTQAAQRSTLNNAQKELRVAKIALQDRITQCKEKRRVLLAASESRRPFSNSRPVTNEIRKLARRNRSRLSSLQQKLQTFRLLLANQRIVRTKQLARRGPTLSQPLMTSPLSRAQGRITMGTR